MRGEAAVGEFLSGRYSHGRQWPTDAVRRRRLQQGKDSSDGSVAKDGVARGSEEERYCGGQEPADTDSSEGVEPNSSDASHDANTHYGANNALASTDGDTNDSENMDGHCHCGNGNEGCEGVQWHDVRTDGHHYTFAVGDGADGDGYAANECEAMVGEPGVS